jgi:hypothetical protein
VADELMDYLQGAEIIIHNAPFDVGFLNKELELIGRPPFALRGQRDRHPGMAKEMYPGKRNSLDALCDRLGVDNSGRTLHGALLDAELLADVYINLTRGQDALLIDVSAQDAGGGPAGGAGGPEPVCLAGDRGQRAGGCRARRCAQAAGQGQWRQDALAGSGTVRLLWHNLRLFRTRWTRCFAKRVISSAVEHCLHTAGVTCSIHVSPTSFKQKAGLRGRLFRWRPQQVHAATMILRRRAWTGWMQW